MTNSFSRVSPLSNEQIDDYAKIIRTYYRQDKSSYFDVIGCLKSGTVPTVMGVKPLDYIVRPERSLGTDEALTRHENGRVTIETTERVHNTALFGEGRSRFTLTHELGHAVLHDGMAMPRSSLKLVKPAWIEDYRSAEHQANRLAGSTLVYKAFVVNNMSIQEIAVEFGVSYLTAKLTYDEIGLARDHSNAAERVKRIAASFSEKKALNQQKEFLRQQCPQCGLHKMFPIAGKYMCDNCNIVSSALQDGDSE